MIFSMSPYEQISLLVSVLGFLAVIITLVFLIRQTQEMAKQSKYVAETIKVSIYQGSEDKSIAIDQVFVTYPELRPYFYSGQDIDENHPDYSRVLAVADLMLDFFDSILLQPQYFPATFLRESWEQVIVGIFANSPMLCRHLQSIQDWHSDELKSIMERGEARQRQVGEERDARSLISK